MGKEINSGVLIMQYGDTDLILCLSTWADILMHSALLLSSTQEVFTLFVQSLERKTLPVWQRLHHCLNHLKTLMKMLGNTLCFVWLHRGNRNVHFYWKNVNAKCHFDNWCWQLSRCLEGELCNALTGHWIGSLKPLFHFGMVKQLEKMKTLVKCRSPIWIEIWQNRVGWFLIVQCPKSFKIINKSWWNQDSF